MKLRKIDQNILIDLVMLAFFLVSGITGLMLHFRLKRFSFLGWNVTGWHRWSSIGFLVIVGTHLLFHLGMIGGYLKNLTRRKKK